MSHAATCDEAPAFDALAAGYDQEFTHSLLGGLLRGAVHRRLGVRFTPGMRVLELGCGTGEDAVFLARQGVRVTATDGSPRMLDLARHKVRQAGLQDRVELSRLDLGQLASEGDGAPEAELYDGAFSNFGALNCVAATDSVARSLARRLRPGAPLVLCVMGPLVPWEWLWFLSRGRPRQAFRRLRRGGAQWRGLEIHYPAIGRLRRDFAPDFKPLRVAALGAFLPPTYAGGWTARWPALTAWLSRVERRLETLPPLPWLADHYLLELEQR